ncbi:RING-H2 finger protein ATL65 [Canna indica]|uniref:RING-type E3 ubiquitin transferase n=1 Tax=Canna indica TaxID=4628 RepID=A0AAQ3PX27_9LILI|nr:RING-H2 finger protein ATL65 [Canna indica]
MRAPSSSQVPYEFEWGPSPAIPGDGGSNPAPISPDFSPPLIAMVAVVGTAFLIVLYARIISRRLRLLRRRWRRWRLRRRLLQSTAAASDLDSPPPFGGGFLGASFGSSSDYFLSPYGLDDAAIKALPVSLFSRAKAKQLAATNRECAVCLLEFEDDDTLRTLPLCAHAFHMDCIDVWLRSHATCPLCRAAVLRHEAAFVPMRAARIRPSLDDILLTDQPPAQPDPGGAAILLPEPDPEIAPAAPSPIPSEDRFGPRDFLLKRSYSFGFERSLAAERMVMEASTASPWRYRHHRGGFWSKRWPSPFGGVGIGSSSASRAARVFSFRSYRGTSATLAKSPAFFKRRGFFPLSSEPSGRLSIGAGPSSRRTRSMTSPPSLFLRPSSSSSVVFSSSRMRCGDPEALLSPERLK